VLRELKIFPSTLQERREFLKDVTAWRRIGDKCGDKIAALSKWGWYFDDREQRAGFCMKFFQVSLDEKLSHSMLMKDRFDLCDQVLQVMVKLQQEFPFLMFPDIKPKNFLCQPQSNGHQTVVMTDLDEVRRVGSCGISRHTDPYRHPLWRDDTPTTKLFEQYAVTVTLLQILLGMRSRQDKWVPVNEVRTFRNGNDADTNLSNLREFDTDKLITTTLTRFFKKEFDGPGYLEVRELMDDIPVYAKMKSDMAGIASRSLSLIQRPATSGLASSPGYFKIGDKPWTVSSWQDNLLLRISRWEETLNRDSLKTFQCPYEQGKSDVLKSLKEMKRAVGNQPSDLSRVHLVSGVRAVVENIMKQLIRIMRGDPKFDPKTLQDPWPATVMNELRQEKKNRIPSLDKGFYHSRRENTKNWMVQGATNIERIIDNLYYLRQKTNAAHHTASLTLSESEKLFDPELIHTEFFPRLGLFFESVKDRAGGPEYRLLQ